MQAAEMSASNTFSFVRCSRGTLDSFCDLKSAETYQ